MSHPERLLVNLEKILTQWDAALLKVDLIETVKINVRSLKRRQQKIWCTAQVSYLGEKNIYLLK